MSNKNLAEKTDAFGIPNQLVEMARIGDAGPYSFWVYTEPLKNPSFHMKHKTDFEIVLQIKDLKILEVKHNKSKFKFEKNELPPGPILKLANAFLNQKHHKKPSLTNQEMIDLFWDALNN